MQRAAARLRPARLTPRPFVLRCYATPAQPPPGQTGKSNTQSGKQDPYASSPWRRPLAAAQTLSLFSDSPPALLFALEQSLQGALSALGKTSENKDQDYVLLFAVDKTLPRNILGEATRMLRDIPLPHVGVLTDGVPSDWLPAEATRDPSASTSVGPSRYHAISVSLLPSSLITPFYSDIPGTPEVKAGRWATGKPSFEDSTSRLDDLEATEGGLAWREVWGRENASGRLPAAFDSMGADRHLATMILGSDVSPQGLLEGLDRKYGARGEQPSPLLGSYASNTYFETGGRERCMFIREAGGQDGKADEGQVVEKGAVGAILALPQSAASESQKEGLNRPSISFSLPWSNLMALGGTPGSNQPRRRRITRAKGNIISELDGSNACQHFLRDVAARLSSPSADQADAAASKVNDKMDAATQRLLSASVGKEEEFWGAVWRGDGTSGGGTSDSPVLLSRILSGHPGRGTVSLDTDLELSIEEGEEMYLEFYQRVNQDQQSATPASDDQVIISIPGKDLGAWALPRFLFVNVPASADAVSTTPEQTSSKDADAKTATKKPQVHALPNLFVLPSSEPGLLIRQGGHQPSSASASAVQGKGNKKEPLEGRTGTWRLPGSRALLDLRGSTTDGNASK